MNFSQKRLSKELKLIKKDPIEDIEINVSENDIYLWNGFIRGPKDTPYYTGKFPIQIKFNDDYPLKPPSVKFTKYIYHPNVYRDGKICVDILQGKWAPSQNIRSILISIRSLLMDPNPDSPANREAAKLYVNNLNEFNNNVLKYIKSNNCQASTSVH